MTRRGWCSVAVQFVSKRLFSHGAEVCWRADERVRVWPISIRHTGRSKSKNRDKQLTFIVRVRFSKQIISVTINTRFHQKVKSLDTSEISRLVTSFRTVSHNVTNVTKWH